MFRRKDRMHNQLRRDRGLALRNKLTIRFNLNPDSAALSGRFSLGRFPGLKAPEGLGYSVFALRATKMSRLQRERQAAALHNLWSNSPSEPHHITAPSIQGTNSSVPNPCTSERDCRPEAVSSISSNIRLPTSSTDRLPSKISPQLISISSVIRR